MKTGKASVAEAAELSGRLTSALWAKDIGLTKEALAAGADPSGRDSYGDVPLRLALTGNFFEGAQALLEAGAGAGAWCNDAPLLSNLMWSMDDPEKAARWLIERGADPSQSDGEPEGQRPAHFAALYGRLGALEALIEAGADVDGRNAAGMTPLMMAACSGHLECCERLLSLGARAERKDGEGHDALYWAKGRDVEGEGVVDLLLMAVEREALSRGTPAAPMAPRGRAL